MDPLKKNLVIGDWVLHREIGKGGQGVVWEVRYSREKHSPPGAMKICLSTSEKAIARFEREVELTKRFSHPGIMRVRDKGEYGKYPFYVMEHALVGLDKIADMRAKPGVRLLQKSPLLLLTYFRQVCGAVAHLHEHGVLHRDITPGNILLVDDGREPLRAVLVDFGIASEEGIQGSLTATHEVVGTPAYRAPEVAIGHRATMMSDVYGLARVLEFLVTRRHPIELEPSPCPRGGVLDESLCAMLDTVIAKGAAWKPEDRYSNAAELLAAIPELVVSAKYGARMGVDEPDSEASMDDVAVEVLARIVGECVGGSFVRTYAIRYALSHISDYDLSLALRRLVRAQFIVEFTEDDDFGNSIPVCRVTSAGLDWADHHRHRVRTVLAVGGRDFPGEDLPRDIPF